MNNNTLTIALKESERFIEFLNNKFNLKLPNNYLITISKTTKKTTGYFMGDDHKEHFVNTKQNLNNINLNTYYLKTNSPYEVLAHELAHLVNHIKGVKDCSSNQYHNKHFKKQAEGFLLKVERGKRGYSKTTETEEFKEMVKNDFKADTKVFNIFQKQGSSVKVGSRLNLYICSCGIKVRCAKHLNAVCLDCKTKFIKVVA